MQKFDFRLESVLNLKTQIEDNAKNNLAKATQELEHEIRSLEQLRNLNEELMQSFNSEVDAGIAVFKIKNYNSFFTLMKHKIISQKENVNAAQNHVDENREALVKAMQERKILEKLKEKKFQEFIKEQNKAEQLLIDELNSFKFKDGPGEENAR